MDAQENKTEDSQTIRSFADVQVTEDNFFEKFSEEKGTPFYYLHKRTRSFHIGKFSFEEFVLTVYGERENQEWINTYVQLPLEERTQIVEYHPELVSQIERPVGSNVIRGAVSTSQIPDQKVVNSNAGTSFAGLQLKK